MSRQNHRLPHDFKWDSQAELDLLRHLCLTNFWFFFLYGFGASLNPKGQRWIEEKVHRPIADWFQKHADEWLEGRRKGHGEQKHLAIVIHREVGKTTLITQAGQLWLHLRDPEMSTYTGSEKLELAQKIMESMKAVIDGSDPYALWPLLFGNWSGAARKWTGKEIVHSARKNTSRRDPSFGTFGVETSITGTHPDGIFYDDPISYERLKSDTNWLDVVNTQITSLVPVLQSDGIFVTVGTRYDDGDHIGTSLNLEGVASVSGMTTDQFEIDDAGKWHLYFLAGRDDQGNPTTPKVWSNKRLNEYERRDPLLYAAQILNDPTLSAHNPLTRDEIRAMIVKSDQVPWFSMRFAIVCDLALWDGKSKIRKDETVFEVWGYPRNGSGDVYFIEGYGSDRWMSNEFTSRIVATVQRYRKQKRTIFAITAEEAMAGMKGILHSNLRNAFSDVNEPMPHFIEFKRGGAQRKADRMAGAAMFWRDGHVRLVEGAPGLDKLIDQMASIGQYMIGSKKRSDWADCASDVFKPELYQPMRRMGDNKAPWEKNSTLIATEGLDSSMWDDELSYSEGREPLR